jgi:hypothetical protein
MIKQSTCLLFLDAIIVYSNRVYSLNKDYPERTNSPNRRHLHSGSCAIPKEFVVWKMKRVNIQGQLNHKEVSDVELVRSFVESQSEEVFNEVLNRYASLYKACSLGKWICPR